MYHIDLCGHVAYISAALREQGTICECFAFTAKKSFQHVCVIFVNYVTIICGEMCLVRRYAFSWKWFEIADFGAFV